MELGVLGHERLDEQRRAVRVEARAEPVRHHLYRVARDRGRIGVVGEGMPVRDEVVALVCVLQLDPVVERAEIVAQVDLPARPRSEEHTSELQSRQYLVCRLLLEKKKNTIISLKKKN